MAYGARLRDPLAEAVVRVRPLVHARQPLYPGILRHSQRHAVLHPKLLELSHDAVGDAGDAFRVQAVHHALAQVQLVLYAEVDEVCVEQDAVRRPERSVVTEEHARGRLVSGMG